MQRPNHSTNTQPTNTFRAQIRARTCLHLCSGDAVGAFIEFACGFEDRPIFSSKRGQIKSRSAAQWVSGKIEDIAAMCEMTDNFERPLVLPVPASALSDPDMLDACNHAAAQTRLCNQEISFELTDAAITARPENARIFMHTFRRKGFRVSIDARKSWQSNLPAHDWLLIDTLRLHATSLESEPSLESYIGAASQAGVAIVAQAPYWRDGEYLASLGIDYGLSPRTDA